MASTSPRCGPAAGRPVARQYSSRLARPDRCGRKPGPSTNDAEPGQGRRPGVHLAAEDRDRAGVRVHQAHQRAQRRGLAGAVRPEQAENLAVLHPQRQAVHRELPVARNAWSARRSPAAHRRARRISSSRPRLRRSSRISAAAARAAAGAAQAHHGAPLPVTVSAGSVGTVRPARQRDPVDRGRRRGGVGEVGRGQYQPEPVAGREAVVDRRAGVTVTVAAALRAADPQRRGQVIGQDRVAALVHVVDLGEQRHLHRGR